ncbi:MAG: hypothetical protein AB8G86_16025 [Saprospiraceae bacterium]
MKKPIPKSESIVAYLRFKGWKVIDKSDGYFILTPPKDVTPNTIKYKIPYYEEEYVYPLIARERERERVRVRVREIADLYGWNQGNLIKLLSKETIEIENALQNLMLQEETAA